jgi:uncharacterized protein YggE
VSVAGVTRIHLRSLLLAAACCALAPAARADTATPSIAVSGEATLNVAPDTATIEGGVTTDARTAKEAAEANNKAMGAVLLALKASGIDEKDMQTARLSLTPQMAPSRVSGNTTSSISGYRASNRVVVTLREVGRVAAVIDTLVGAGANDIGGIGFSVSQASKLLDEARSQALADARRKAEIYAAAAGVTLGAPLSISEEGAPGPILYGRAKMAAPMAAGAPVAIGEEMLRVGVNVVWAIKQP